MKERFREPTIRTNDRKRLASHIIETITHHQDQGIRRVTSRQLYYRLVAANMIANTEKSYKLITALLTDMRYWGMIDWNFIVDLGREPIIPQDFESINELAEVAASSLRYDRWTGQEYYVEVWVEKQALQSVLEPIGRDLHVPVVVNKGYSSASAMYVASKRIERRENGRETVILYFGDLDPSGEDMVRDITDRLEEFGVEPTIIKRALNLDQVLKFKCPPNPAKMTDTRFRAFEIAMLRNPIYRKVCQTQGISVTNIHSWELDSLPVEELSAMVTAAVKKYITKPKLVENIIRREDRDRASLQRAAEAIANGDFK